MSEKTIDHKGIANIHQAVDKEKFSKNWDRIFKKKKKKNEKQTSKSTD